MAELKLNITFATAPTSAVATIAPFKYNKLGAYCQEWDDGSKGARMMLPFMRTLTYTDGCNNNIFYSGGVALNSGTGIPGDFAYNANYYQKDELLDFVAKGWDIENHSDTHGGVEGNADPIKDLNDLDARILLRTGYQMAFTVVPTNYVGYLHASSLRGYKGGDSEGDATFDEFIPVRVHKKFPAVTNPFTLLAMVRDFCDDWDLTTKKTFLKGEIDKLLTGERDYEIVGTHSTFETTAKEQGFYEIMNYIKNTTQDKVIVCPIREILDYREMQALPFTQSLNGNILTITVNIDSISDKNRWRDMCFNINTPGTITGVTYEGFTGAAFNATTKLINGYSQKVLWDGSTLPDPDPEPEPGTTKAIKLGKNILKVNGGTPTPDPNFGTPTAVESQYFTNMYLASEGKTTSGTKAVNGQEIDQIPDLIGTAHMNYAGISPAALTNGRGVMVNSKLLPFENQPNTHYESAFYTPRALPYEVWVVSRDLPGQQYEGRLPGGFARIYWGAIDFKDRIINSSYGALPDSSYQGKFKLNLTRIRVNANGSADHWVNGQFIANLPFQGDDLTQALAGQYTKQYNGVGVNTNVADWQFAQMGVVFGSLSDANALTLQNNIYNRWSDTNMAINTVFDGIILNNLVWTHNAGVITPNFTVINNSGKTLKDPTQWNYLWHYKTNQTNYAIQPLIGNTRTITTSAYPVSDSTHTGVVIKFRVQPVFNDGTTYPVYISGIFSSVP